MSFNERMNTAVRNDPQRATNACVPFGKLDYNIIIRISALRNCPLIYSGVDFFGGGAFSMCAIKLTPKLDTQN